MIEVQVKLLQFSARKLPSTPSHTIALVEVSVQAVQDRNRNAKNRNLIQHCSENL